MTTATTPPGALGACTETPDGQDDGDEAVDPIAAAYARGAIDGGAFVFCASVVLVLILCALGGGW